MTDATMNLKMLIKGSAGEAVPLESWHRYDGDRYWVMAPGQTCLTSCIWWDERDSQTNYEARLGGIPNSYQLAEKFVEVTISDYMSNSEYADFNLVVTGHSLGGGMASYAAAKDGLASYVFNPARNRAAGFNDGKSQTRHSDNWRRRT